MPSWIIATKPQRRRSLRNWQRWEQVALGADKELDELVFNWQAKRINDLDVKGALVSCSIERTIEGGSTVTITVADPDQRLFSGARRMTSARADARRRSGQAAFKRAPTAVDEGWDPILPPDLAGRAVELELDGVVFRLVKVRYSTAAQEAELTFEDRVVYLLKRKRGTKRAKRENVTRAEFVLSLLREVKAGRYRFYCPELHTRQPIDSSSNQAARRGEQQLPRVTTSTQHRTTDVPRSLDHVYPRHRIGAAGAKRLSERAVRAAAEFAGLSPTDALHAMQIAKGESNLYPGVVQDDPGDGMVGHGLWQMTPNAWGGSSSATYRHMQSLGGLAAMRNPIQAARQMAWMFHQSGDTWRQWYGVRYLNLSSRASKSVLSDFQNADVVTSGEGDASQGGYRTKSYQYARNADEDSWTAIKRLADEVGWRCFVVGNTVYYMSEADLYGRRIRYEIEPDDPAILDLAYDVDWGKRTSEMTATVMLDRWGAPPGSVVNVSGYGPPDGRWLIVSMRRDYFAPTAELTLRQPGKEKLEPAAEKVQRASNASGSGGSASTKQPASKADKVYAEAKRISQQNMPYVWGGGHARAGVSSGGGFDCSGYTVACLAAAGLGFDKGGGTATSGTLMSWGQSGRGDKFTVWANRGHVWIQFHGYPAWRADTSSYGSGPSGPKLRTTSRPTAGFTPRHWRGL